MQEAANDSLIRRDGNQLMDRVGAKQRMGGSDVRANSTAVSAPTRLAVSRLEVASMG